jgi:hypothetical protein
MAHTSRACEAEPSDALRQQTDPLEPAGRRFANFFFEQFFFEIPLLGRTLARSARRRASAARYGVDFDTTPIETALNWGGRRWSYWRRFLARARAAPTRRRRSAERPAIRPTRSRRLGGGWPPSMATMGATHKQVGHDSGWGRTLVWRPPRRRARAGFKQ